MDFGMTIRNKRKKLGYTQAQLSEYTGFSTSFISDLENGKETAELGKALFFFVRKCLYILEYKSDIIRIRSRKIGFVKIKNDNKYFVGFFACLDSIER